MNEKPRLTEKKPDKKELYNFWFFNSKSQRFYWQEFIKKHNLTNLEKILIPYLVSRSFDMDKPNTCFPSQATVANDLKISKGGIIETLKKLQERKWIEVDKKHTTAKHKVNFYILGKFKKVFLNDYEKFLIKLQESNKTAAKTSARLPKELNKKRIKFVRKHNKRLRKNDPENDYSSLIGLLLKVSDYDFAEAECFINDFIETAQNDYCKDDFAEIIVNHFGWCKMSP